MLEASVIWLHFALTIIVRTHFLHACSGKDCLPVTLYNYFTPRSMPELIFFLDLKSKRREKKEWSQRKKENEKRKRSLLYSTTLKCTAVAQISKLEILNNQAAPGSSVCTLLWQVGSPHTSPQWGTHAMTSPLSLSYQYRYSAGFAHSFHFLPLLPKSTLFIHPQSFPLQAVRSLPYL